ncbi:MurR/RpiR family transcriptional regulator [Globicatella sanguinis]
MSNTLTKLRVYRPTASQTERSIIDYVLKNPLKVGDMSIHHLAEATFSSPTSIIRLCKKIGYDGYKSFSKELLYEQAVRENVFELDNQVFNQNDNSSELIQSVILNNLSILRELTFLISDSLIDQCVSVIEKADKIVFFGIGASLIVAKDAQMKFARINKMVHVSEDWHTQLLMARNMNANDLAFSISYSGETDEVIKCAQEAKNLGATIITMTKEGNSRLSQLSTYPLFVPNSEIGMRSAAMSSRIAQMTLIDVIFSSYLHNIYDEGILMIERTRILKGDETLDQS